MSCGPRNPPPLLQKVFGRIYLAQYSNTGAIDKIFKKFRPDKTVQYFSLCDDFGPYNMACTLRFVQQLDFIIATTTANKKIAYCVDEGQRALSNAIFLVGSYMMLKLDYSASQLAGIFANIFDEGLIENFRDATFSTPDFTLSLEDCWKGLERGALNGWIKKSDLSGPDIWGKIDLDEYSHYDDPLNGDLHEVVPGAFIAFKGPKDLGQLRNGAPRLYYDDQRGYRCFSPAYYIDIFHYLGVTDVVRLNEPEYDPATFEAAGIRHHALEFEDCTPPPAEVAERFFRIVSAAGPGAAIAVHCKAGLGRTGTLIALAMMRFHHFAPREAMGWLRIMRPGSVIGPQQQYLCAAGRSLAGGREDAPPTQRAASGTLPATTHAVSALPTPAAHTLAGGAGHSVSTREANTSQPLPHAAGKLPLPSAPAGRRPSCGADADAPSCAKPLPVPPLHPPACKADELSCAPLPPRHVGSRLTLSRTMSIRRPTGDTENPARPAAVAVAAPSEAPSAPAAAAAAAALRAAEVAAGMMRRGAIRGALAAAAAGKDRVSLPLLHSAHVSAGPVAPASG